MSIHPVNKKGHSHCRGIINTQSPQKKIESERIQNFSRRPLGYFIIQQKINKINKSYEKIKQLDSVSSIDSRFSSLCVFNIHNNRYVTAITRKPHSRLLPPPLGAAQLSVSFLSFKENSLSWFKRHNNKKETKKKIASGTATRMWNVTTAAFRGILQAIIPTKKKNFRLICT